MCTKLISFVCVLTLALASISYAVNPILVGNWEGSYDNWQIGWGSALMDFSGIGATLDGTALRLVTGGSWADALQLRLQEMGMIPMLFPGQDDHAYTGSPWNMFECDITVLSTEWLDDGDPGTDPYIAMKMVLNTGGNNAANEWGGVWYDAGDVVLPLDQTTHCVWDFKAGIAQTVDIWNQCYTAGDQYYELFLIPQNSGYILPVTYHLDAAYLLPGLQQGACCNEDTGDCYMSTAMECTYTWLGCGTDCGGCEPKEPNMTPDEQATTKTQLQKAQKALEDLLAKVNTAVNDLNDMISKETDAKKKAALEAELAKLLDFGVRIQNEIAAVQAALNAITTITKTAIQTLLGTITDVINTLPKIISGLPEIVRAALQAALDIAKGVIQGSISILKEFINGIGNLLKSLWSIPKSFFGWLGLCSATDLSSDGVHQLTMTGEGYLQLTLANLDPSSQIVPFESISFSVLSEPGSQPNLRRLTVINGTFVATLASFTVNGKVIGPSTVSIDPDITWTGIYDTNDQSLHLPFGGTITNDYTPSSSPMIFSLTVGGPITSMSCTGSSFEPWSLGQAANPQPINCATRVSLNSTLTWNPGEWVQDVNSHAVYFGLDFNAVNTAGPNDPNGVYMGRQDANSYVPGLLVSNTTYYWRIDENNDANVNSPWRGQVWRFTTGNYLVVDDFERYTDGNSIRTVWRGDPDVNTSTHTINGQIHEGAQAMAYSYNNSGVPYYSEAYADTNGPNSLEIDPNWLAGGVKALSLYFQGRPNNDPELMYVVLQDSDSNAAVVYYPGTNDPNYADANVTQISEWTEWRIDLNDFRVQDVNLTDVQKMYIGFGNLENPTLDGSGIVFIDDIRLYLAEFYAPKLTQRPADFVFDGIIDWTDLDVLVNNWLMTPPPDPNVDLYPDGTIDFRDFAEFGSVWLEAQVWPQW